MHRLLLLATLLFALPLLEATSDEALARKYFLENDYPQAFKEYKKTASKSVESFVAVNTIRDYQLMQLNHIPYLEDLYETLEDPNPLLFFLANSDFFRSNIHSKVEEMQDFIEEVLEGNKINPIVRALYLELISNIYLQLDEFEDSEQALAKLGTIDNWSFVGPFENVSGSQYDTEYPPIAKPKADEVFVGKSDIEIKWFDYHENHPGRWLSLSGLFDITEALFYSQSFVYSETDQEVVFGLGVSGSLKFWVNDELIYTNPKEENNGIDSYMFTAKLNKGYNRILIQLGSGENQANNFLLRVLDKDFNPLPKFKSESRYQQYTPSKGYKSRIIPNFAIEYYNKNIKGTEKEPVLFNLLASYYRYNSMNEELRLHVESLIKQYPDCFNFLDIDKANTAANKDLESTYQAKMEALKNSKFKTHTAAIARMEEHFDKEDWDAALKVLDSLENEGASDYMLFSLRSLLLTKNEEYRKFVDMSLDIYDRYPHISSAVNRAFIIVSYDQKLLARAYEVYEEYLDDYYHYEFTNALAQYYWQINRRGKAEDLFEKMVKYSRESYSVISQLGDFYKQQGLFDEALEYYYQLLERVPYGSRINGQIADCYKEQKMQDSAIKYYKASLKYYPGNFDNRTALRKLEDKKDPFEYFVEPKVDSIIKSAENKDYGEENAVFLHIEDQHILYNSGATEEINYMVAKALTQTGVDMLKETHFGYYTDIIKAEVIKQDGTRVQADESDGMIVFTKLEPGDVIYYKVKSTSYIRGILSKYFETSSYLNSYIPLETAKLSILVENGIDINYKTTQCNIEPTIKDVENMKMYVWEANQLPKIEPETLMPPSEDVNAIVHVSTIKDWDFISKWYYAVSNPKTKPLYDVELKSKELFEGKENLSDFEKAKIIYKYIAEEIRYSSVPFRQSGLVPQNPTKTIDSKIGDCKDVSILFVSLCKTVGLDAEIVLVNNRDNGRNDLALPSTGFEHVIGKVKIDGKTYYVELTSDMLPFGSFYGSSKKSYGLEINQTKNNSLFQIDPDTRPENSVTRYTKARLENSNMIVEINSTKVGGSAASMRRSYRDETPENQRKSMTSSISEDYSSTELIDLKFNDNLKDLSDSVTYSYSYKVKQPYTQIKNLMVIKFPWTDVLRAGDLTSEQERKYPVALWKFMIQDRQYNHVEFEIPEGMKVAEIPESVKLNSDFADYEVSYKVEGNKLIGVRTVTYKNDVIPVEKYQEFKKFYDQMVEHDNKQFALEQ